MAAQGDFREDLLDRLSFDVVHLPPLRHRLSDVPELAHHFAVQMCSELGWDYFPGFTDSAARQLLQYHWPGNVRELKNVVERSVARWEKPGKAVGEVVIDPFTSPFSDAFSEPPAKTAPTPRQAKPVAFARTVAALEKQLLRDALEASNQHQGKAAEALGLSYDQFRGLLRKHRIGRRAQPAKEQRKAPTA